MAQKPPIHPADIPENDRAVVELLRFDGPLSVGELVDKLGVTATAIRQRLTRLMGNGLIERTQTPDGRGRPRHQYILTDVGRNSVGTNLSDLAHVLWQEVQLIENEETKRKVIAGVVQRLAAKYEAELGDSVADSSMETKLDSFTKLFAEKQIPIEYKQSSDGLPVITVSGCPYPELAQDNREICDMEKQLLAKIVGAPVDLCSCQQDGDNFCSFEAIGESSAASEQP